MCNTYHILFIRQSHGIHAMKLKSMTMNFMFAKWQATRLFSRLSLSLPSFRSVIIVELRFSHSCDRAAISTIRDKKSKFPEIVILPINIFKCIERIENKFHIHIGNIKMAQDAYAYSVCRYRSQTKRT